jgi:hypothetical protein
MQSLTYKKIHLTVLGRRTTINVNVYLMALFIRKRTGEKANPLNITDTNVSVIRQLIQREIDAKNDNDFMHVYPRLRLKERIEEFLIKEIADPKLLK